MNEKAVGALIEAMEECKGLMVQIEGEIDDHMGVSPEMVTWATVGDANRLKADLTEIVDWLGTRYTEQVPVADRLRSVLQRISDTPEAGYSLGQFGISEAEDLGDALDEVDGTMAEAEQALRAALELLDSSEHAEAVGGLPTA